MDFEPLIRLPLFLPLTWDWKVPHSPSSDKIARRKKIVLLRKKSWGEDGRKKPKRSGFLFLGRSSFSCYVTCCIHGAPTCRLVWHCSCVALSACWCFEALLRVYHNMICVRNEISPSLLAVPPVFAVVCLLGTAKLVEYIPHLWLV